jgi:hypothetical protein
VRITEDMFPITRLRLPLLTTGLACTALLTVLDLFATRGSPPAPLVTEPVATSRRQVLELTVSPESASPGCLYYSSFGRWPVEVARGQQELTLYRRFWFMDGCEWESEERLRLVSDSVYQYAYSERVVACQSGKVPASACTRSGFAVAQRP